MARLKAELTVDDALTLANAVLLQAVEDIQPPYGRPSRRLRREALDWLCNDWWAAELVMAIGLDPDALRRWAVKQMKMAV